MNIARAVAYLIAGTSLTATAQVPVKPPLPVPVPELLAPYRSAFTGYRSYLDAEPIAWRRANDDAAAIGGPLGQMAKDVVPSAVAKPAAATTVPANADAVTPAPARNSR